MQANCSASSQQLQTATAIASPSSVLNLANSSTVLTQTQQQQQQQPSKLFLVAKDFSLRSPGTCAAAQSGISPASKRSLDGFNGSPIKQASAGTTSTLDTNKRPRVNGTVIDVNEVIQAAAAVNAATAQPPVVAMTMANNTSSSKYVTGSFDLEEHIRALPQLTQPAMMQSRNAQLADSKNLGSSNLLVVTSKSVNNPLPNGFVSFPASSITSKHSNIVTASTSKPSLIALSTVGGNEAVGIPLRMTTSSGAAPVSQALARVQTSAGSPAGAPMLIKLAVPAGGAPIAMVNPLVTMVNNSERPPTDGTTSTMVNTGGNIHTPATNLILAAAAAATANQGSVVSRPVDLNAGQATVVSRPSQAYISAMVTSHHQSLPIISIQSSSAVNASPLTISTTTVAASDPPTSSGQSSPLLSTVISSQGSINQCDGLAALAEIALAQQARLN